MNEFGSEFLVANSENILNKMENIFPDFDKIISRTEKEERLNQRGKVFWFTGLSGSGKSTIAGFVERKLFLDGVYTQVLDGDNVRAGLNKDLGFSMEDREENIRRIAEIAKLYLNSGIVTLVSFISPTQKARDYARDIIGAEDFHEIYINTPLEICEERDVKGLYKKARAGEIKDFSGISSPYEAPSSPSIEIRTDSQEVSESVDLLYTFALQQIKLT